MDTVEQQVEALARLDLDGLRVAWLEFTGQPTVIRSRDMVRRMLAFEMQARVSGGLDPELLRRLRLPSARAAVRPAFQPGTTITRQWRGETHVVEVIDGGFVHRGASYASLSEVARAITGARWSGPRFFGLVAASEGRPA